MKNKETILLAKIRKLIRRAIDWSKVDDGYPHFYTTENWKRSKRKKCPVKGDFPYYSKKTKAIEDIAKKILIEIKREMPSKIKMKTGVTIEAYISLKDRIKLLFLKRKWKFVCCNALITVDMEKRVRK